MEVEDLDLLVEHVDATNFKKACLYLTRAAKYLTRPDDMLVLDIAYMNYLKFEEFPNTLQIALSLDNMQGMTLELDDNMVPDEDDRYALQDIVNNTKLSEGYRSWNRNLLKIFRRFC